MVGETGFEPATPGTQNQRSTKLSYSPRGLAKPAIFRLLPLNKMAHIVLILKPVSTH